MIDQRTMAVGLHSRLIELQLSACLVMGLC